ncbi:RNA polymerase sigma factor [Prevotella disiens]|uniref:RNA polymerase sigma factor n=1 Tax=Prevotella disiens TaxID=28130 RepID=UPI000B13AC61|nr:sigma factor [Prevotella disiens]
MEIEQFNRIVTNLQASLLRQARTLEGGDADANDFVQETFLRLWTMRERLDKHQNIEALAMATLKHIAIDHWSIAAIMNAIKGSKRKTLSLRKTI